MAFRSGARRAFTNQVRLDGGFEDLGDLAADVTLDGLSAQWIRAGATGANRSITAPDDRDSSGLSFVIVNDGSTGFSLLFKNAAGTTIATIAPNRRAIVGFDDTNDAWVHFGSVAVTI